MAEANTAPRVFVFWGSDSWWSLWATNVSAWRKSRRMVVSNYVTVLLFFLIMDLTFDWKVLKHSAILTQLLLIV